MYLCIQWQDDRLKKLKDLDTNVTGQFPPVVVVTKMDRFWEPLLYFRNGLSSSVVNSIVDLKYGFIYPENQTIRYCSRMSNSYSCEFHFSSFPFDEQYCRFELEDCKYNISYI